ncbi:sugar ABC transporter ATP-binding protein, partial [Rhizobium leguminosarum]
LVKYISGLQSFDEGEILGDGAPVSLHAMAAARRAGIETVYQDLALVDNLTPVQKFYGGREISFPSWLPRPLRCRNTG